MKNSNKERGVALLYVLGILALLMTMGLAFVSSSLFDQKAASNNAATELADKLAASTLEKVLYGIQNDDPGINYSYMPDDHYGTSPKKISKDGLEALETYDVINGKDKAYIFEWNAPHNKEIRENIRWILHRVNAGKDSLGNPIDKVIGRSAFVLIKLSEGKVNPLYLVKAGVQEETNPEKRRGVEVNEINLQSLNSTIFVPDFVKYMNIAATGDGIQLSSGWPSYSDFITEMSAKVTIPQEQRDILNDLFIFATSVESEEFFWMDINKDGKIDANEKFHRFHLPNFIDTDDDYISTTDTNEFSVDRNRWERSDFDINREILMSPDSVSGKVTLDITDVAAPWRQYDSGHSPPTPPLTKSEIDNVNMAVFGIGIPWLAGFGYDKDGNFDNTGDMKATFPTVLARRRQIAANLKDYCDTDDVPTSDVTPSQWSLTNTSKIPTYTGNELTPYLDAVEAKVSITGGWMADTAYCELKVDIAAQLINIYKQLIGNYKTAKIKIGYTLAYDIELKVSNNANPDPAPITSDGTTVKTFEIEIDTESNPWPDSGDKAYNYQQLITVPGELRLECIYQQPAFTSPDPPPDPPLASFSVKNVRLTITNVMLEYGGQNVDYAKIDSAASVPDFIRTDIAKTGLTSHDYFALLSWQTNDPRQNLNPGDWEASSITAGLTSDDDCTEQSMLNPNNKMFGGKAISPAAPPGTDPGEFDPETVTDPATDGNNQMSTAYIRNAPMLSPWELGFIHRGQAWQTLNLKNYDREKAITPITSGSIQILPGGGLYSKGDANILDQVKMTIDAKSKDKKINLKAQGKRSKEILSALFHVKTGANLSNSDLVSKVATSSNRDDYLNEVAGVTLVSDEDRNSIAQNIQYRSPGLLTRAGIAEEESLRKGATDAEQEEIIGKMINLTELSEDLEFFELIILSQAIKDVGNYNDVTGSIPIKKSYFYDGATKTTDIDAKVGEINFEYADGKDRIADEITAQRKIRVRGYRKSDHSVQLISIKQSE